MKTDLKVKVRQEAISLITNITYKMESYWYGETQQPLKMSMLLPKHKEQHKERLPLVVWFCGGGFQVVDKDIWLPQLLPLAREGFIVASVQYRTVNDAPLPASLIDAKAAIRYLKAHADQYLIDTKNVFAMGESAGAAIASMVGTLGDHEEYDQGDFLEQSSKVNAVVDFYGPVDREPIKPIDYVCKDTVPFLIFHGTSDEKVDIAQSDLFYDKMSACGALCEYYRLEGCLHGVDEFYQPEIMEIVLRFLRRNMK